MKNKKIKPKSHAPKNALDTTLKSTLLSLLLTFAISICLLILSTSIALAMPDPTALVQPIGYVSPFICAFFGGFATSKISKRAPYPSSLLTGAGFVLFSMLISFVLPHSLASGMNILSRLGLHALTFALFPIGTLVGIKASKPYRKPNHKKRR